MPVQGNMILVAMFLGSIDLMAEKVNPSQTIHLYMKHMDRKVGMAVSVHMACQTSAENAARSVFVA